jgi:hypothetical protein
VGGAKEGVGFSGYRGFNEKGNERACGEMTRRDGAIVACHEVPGDQRHPEKAVIVFSDGMIFKSAENLLLAKALLRWIRVSITCIEIVSSNLKSTADAGE